jgi:glycosyltransferase involved in cell wall biosynthesis
MKDLTVIIPSRNEIFLSKTVDDILAKAQGDIEIIAVLDGYWPAPRLTSDKRLTVLHRGRAMGMRAAVNGAAAIAKGKYIMKCDAHCMFAPGFDRVLCAECDDNWVVIPRRVRLDAENWAIQEMDKHGLDYHFLTCPMTNKDGYEMHGQIWRDRDDARHNDPKYEIDDTMSFQGSAWFMSKKHFDNYLHGLSEDGYGPFCQEPQEIGNKTWLGGGRVVANKKTWYAHLHKGRKYGRGYFQDTRSLVKGHTWSARHWINDEEPNMIHKFEWLVDKFWPVPTWPEDWKKRKNEKVR